MTLRVSTTKMRPMMMSKISFLVATPIKPIYAPTLKLPLSPIKTSAGWQLNHKKPINEPIKAEETTTLSPTPMIFGKSKYELKTACPQI